MRPERDDLAEVGFPDADLLETAQEHLGVGVDSRLPPEGRFLVAVTRLLRKRMGVASASEHTPAIFFFRSGNKAPAEAKRFEPLLHNGLAALSSCLWFVGEVTANARAVEIERWDKDGPVFDFAMNGLGVGTWPAVVFDPRPDVAEVWFYPQGIAEADATRQISVSLTSVRLADVFTRIDDLHERYLASPTGTPGGVKLWEKPTKHYPKHNAETLIQAVLHIGLQMTYPTCDVRAERTGAAGRVDLEIHVPFTAAGARKSPAALLELKVLRSFSDGGSRYSDTVTREWIKDGVVQASSYRDEREFPEAALCCFDMRVTFCGDACFAHVRRLAGRRNVELRVWPVFNRPASFRKWHDAKVYGE